MQIQNIITYSLVVIINSNQMTLLHMIIYSHTLITKYSEKRRGVERPKTRSQNLWGTLHRKQKLSDMTVVILSGATGRT